MINQESVPSVAEGEGIVDGAKVEPLFDEHDYDMARKLQPLLFAQITEEYPSFDQIATAWRLRNQPGVQASHEVRLVSRLLEYEARKRFSEKHDQIKAHYWCAAPFAGCALTGDGWVHSGVNFGHPELVRYTDEIHQLCRDAHRTFEKIGRPRNTQGQGDGRSQKAIADLEEVGEILYGVLCRVIFTAKVQENPKAAARDKEEALSALREEYKVARAEVTGLIQRQARFEYFEGVGLGAFVGIPLLGGVAWLAAHVWASQFDRPGAFTAAIISGAIGAVISVTQRMTANTLVLDFTAPKKQKVVLGALRPLVGAVFAAVVYFAFMGGMLAVEARTGKDLPATFAFFAVAGFVSGFSERFATDVLDTAKTSMLGSTRDGPGGSVAQSSRS